jgi:transaldolase
MSDALNLTVKTFADGADISEMKRLRENPMVKGFTTNPTLMRKSGITDYETFAREALEAIPDLPLSFEVFADDFEEMERQALKIRDWGENVYIKIPITNTKGESAVPLLERLAAQGVKVNVTAMMTADQVRQALAVIKNGPAAYVSVFAGRVADTGRDPVPVMAEVMEMLKDTPQIELIWASPREVYDIIRANEIGCHIITVTYDLLAKMTLFGKNLDDFSLETVKMFYDDANSAGYRL